MNSKLHKTLTWAVVLSESTHVFCCVFPTLFSLIGLFAGLGMVVAMPPIMESMHETLHAWEVPMIIGSGLILALGWAAILYSDRIDCHSTGCGHGECAPKKTRAHLVIKIATVLFLFNVIIYTVVHRSDWFNDAVHEHAEHAHEHEAAD